MIFEPPKIKSVTGSIVSLSICHEVMGSDAMILVLWMLSFKTTCSLLLSPGSWYTQGFACVVQESAPPVLCKFWWLYGRVNGDLLQEGLYHTWVYGTQGPAPATVPCWPILPQERLKYSSVSVSVVSLGPGVHKVYLSHFRCRCN